MRELVASEAKRSAVKATKSICAHSTNAVFVTKAVCQQARYASLLKLEIECITVGNLCMVEQPWTVVSGAQDTGKSGSSLSFVQTVKCNTFVCGRILA